MVLLQEVSQDQHLLHGLIVDLGTESPLATALHLHLGLLVLQLRPPNRLALHLGNIMAPQEPAVVHHHLPQLRHGSKLAQHLLTSGTRIIQDQMPLRLHPPLATLVSPTHTTLMEATTHHMAHLHLHLQLLLLAGYVELQALLYNAVYLPFVLYHLRMY